MRLHPRVSAEGVVLARRGERLRREAELDGGGWVIGYGHRVGAREGARVDEDDARMLLVYDLSRTAEQLTPLLRRDPPQPLFDALNAYAWRAGPEALAESDLVHRWNAGEAVTAAEVIDARERAAADGEGPRSAVLTAAAAVRERVSRVLDAPSEPPPPRTPREPWREPSPPAPELDAEGVSLPADAHGEPPAVVSVATVQDERPPQPSSAKAGEEPPPLHQADELTLADLDAAEEPPPPPLLEAVHACAQGHAAAKQQPEPPVEEPVATLGEASPGDLPPPARVGQAPPAPAPVVSFERGGRSRVWERVRGDPRVYMAVGACGLLLFLCALAGAVMARPTPLGVAVGLTGVLCLAPAIAFFLHRRP